MSRRQANVIVIDGFATLFRGRLASVQSSHSMEFLKTTAKLMKGVEKRLVLG
jgi:hypothetical protein